MKAKTEAAEKKNRNEVKEETTSQLVCLPCGAALRGCLMGNGKRETGETGMKENANQRICILQARVSAI